MGRFATGFLGAVVGVLVLASVAGNLAFDKNTQALVRENARLQDQVWLPEWEETELAEQQARRRELLASQ